jgi:hypothetical protein
MDAIPSKIFSMWHEMTGRTFLIDYNASLHSGAIQGSSGLKNKQ